MKNKIKRIRALCQCSCGGFVSRPGNMYVNHHNSRGENNPMYGKNHTGGAKKIMSAKSSGENNAMYGTKRSHSEKTKAKMCMNNTGKNNPMYGKKRKHTKESRRKMSLSLSGKLNPMYGKKRPEHSKRMKTGGAAHANSFIKNPSKPQVMLFKLVKLIYPKAILNYPSLNRSIDVAIPDKMLAIEYDGSYWHKDKEADVKRQTELEGIGWKFLRYCDRVPSFDELGKDLNRLDV